MSNDAMDTLKGDASHDVNIASPIRQASSVGPTETTPTFFNFWTQQLSSKASELVEFGRQSGIVDQANALVELTKENAIELAKQAQDLRESYERINTQQLHQKSPMTTSGKTTNTTTKSDVPLDLTYVTENLIAMAFPYDLSKVKNVSDVTGNDIRRVSEFLEEKHHDHYMIWNISEEAYDYTIFDNQVLDYKFPGHPSPPLGLMFKICTSIESWLDADKDNIGVVHCYTGKGRTATLLACLLCWIGEFSSPIEALQYISERKGISPDKLTIPSQRRYIQYFSNMIDGVKPRSEPLLLRRVIMNTIPIFGENKDTPGSLGCRPYIQLFKNGKLISTTASHHLSTTSDENVLTWVDTNEGTVAFNVDCPVQGDILIRCRHSEDDKRVSMFRAGFHTGYVPAGVLRLTRVQLDGPSLDARFHEDFFIDLIFAPVVDAGDNCPSPTGPSDQGMTLDKDTAEACEDLIHKDVRFWETIANRKLKSRRRAARKFLSASQERFSISDESTHNELPLPPSSSIISTRMETQESAGSTTGGISDNDLILELSMAEADSRFNSPTHAVKGAFLDDFDFQTPVATTTTGGAHSELKALDDLEKELGIDEFVIPKPDGSGQKKLAELQSAVEDDIDELEKYLLSLSSPNK
jgi:hypothetical protein